MSISIYFSTLASGSSYTLDFIAYEAKQDTTEKEVEVECLKSLRVINREIARQHYHLNEDTIALIFIYSCNHCWSDNFKSSVPIDPQGL